MTKYLCIFLSIFGVCSCASKETNSNNIIQKANELAGSNWMLFKGGSAMVVENIYIRKQDKTNSFYNADGVIFKGGKWKDFQVFFISSKSIIKEVNDFSSQDGVYVVFNKNNIFVIDFVNKKYGKYLRSE